MKVTLEKLLRLSQNIRWLSLVAVAAVLVGAALAAPAGAASLTWATKTAMPTARQALMVAMATNGKIYVIGGQGSTGFNQQYDPVANTWAAKTNMPTARYALGVAAAPNGKVYAIGGISAGGAVLNTVEAYDPVANTWATMASMPTFRADPLAVTASNGKIYAIGGAVSGFTATNVVEEYNPATNTWTNCDGACASLPTARWRHGAAGSGNKIYAVGGLGAGTLATNEEATVVSDPTAPTGTVVINGGAATTTTTAVSLALTCSDNVGCTEMQVAVDGAADTEPFEAFATTKAVTLPAVYGTRTVAAKFRDAAGNVSAQATDTIFLDIPAVVTVNETIGVSDAVGVFPPVAVTVNESIGVSDAVNVFPPVAVTVNESIGVSDAVNVFPPVAVTVNETIGVSDAIGVFPPVAVTVDESIGVSDAIGVFPPVAVTVDESIGVSDAVGVFPPVAVTVDESVGVSDAPTVTPGAVDITAPTGSVVINGGAAFTNSISVTLTLTCTDVGSGCAQMQIAVDGTADSEPFEAFATAKAVTLPAGDGTKTVAVKFKDVAGNVSAQFTDTIATSALPQIDLRAAQDVADLATGVRATIDQITDSVGAPLTGVLVASYEANITFPSTLAQATACRLKPRINAAPIDCSILAGQVHLKATSGGVATPIDPLAFVALRLLGSNDPSVGNTTVNLNFVEIRDSLGSLILQASPPDTRTFLRGDALADGNISIGDVLFIGQHLVNPITRPAGEGPGKANPVNAGSVSHDFPNDVITVADAVLIAQFLVGNVNGFYLGSAAPLTLPAGQTVATDAVPPFTSTSQVPEPNVNGWNRTNVSVTLTAIDPSGPAQPGQTTMVSGVKEIRHRVNGGSVVVTAGASARIVLDAAGVHTITYFAVDNAGNQEGAKTLTVRIDKTPPQVTKTVSPAPVDGWVDNDGNSVTATWIGTDDLSGVAFCDTPTVLATGGIHTVAGNCTDKAGNQGSHSQIVKVVTKVPIDIKPGTDPNTINPRSRGNIQVGVKSGPTHGVAFDATAINRATVIFAGALALPSSQSPQDFDLDGDLDMVFHFDTQALNLTASSTQACLTGETTAGLRFKGCDTVRIVPS